MDKMTVYDKTYNKAKLALKLQIEIILESYRKDLANVMLSPLCTYLHSYHRIF